MKKPYGLVKLVDSCHSLQATEIAFENYSKYIITLLLNFYVYLYK